jgi:hypothetical protein
VRLRTKVTAATTGVACAGLLAAALIAGPVASATETAADTPQPIVVPPELVPPAGATLSSTFAAVGVQLYRCTAGVWAFVEPVATLTAPPRGPRGPHTAIHFRGPSWQSAVDGSLVEATVRASVPRPGTIAWLLLESKPTTRVNNGVFGRVTFIQRLRTVGGVAPAGACTTEGQEAGVRYGAEYRFFVGGR